MANNFASFRREEGERFFKGAPVVGGPLAGFTLVPCVSNTRSDISEMARVRGVSYRAPYGRGVLRLMGEQRVTLRARTLTNILLVPSTFSFCFRSHAFGRRLL